MLWTHLRLWLLLLLLGGCTSVDKLADTLNKRHIRSCVRMMGAYAMFLAVEVVSATGGATLAECYQRVAPLPPQPLPPPEPGIEAPCCLQETTY